MHLYTIWVGVCLAKLTITDAVAPVNSINFTWKCPHTPAKLQWCKYLINVETDTLEFFLNECHWILQIQWIRTKSKNSSVTTSTTYLDIVTFSVESTFSLLPQSRYLLPLATLNRYLSSHSSKNFIFTSSSESITIIRCGLFLVTMPVL